MKLDIAAVDELLARTRARMHGRGASDVEYHVAREDLAALLELAGIARMVAPDEVLAVVAKPLRRARP